MRAAAVVPCLLAVAALVWPRAAEPSAPESVTPSPAAAETAPATATAPTPAPAAPPTPRRDQLLLPDGSTVPTLNGALDPAPLADYWGPFPWSPIVARERSSAGVDWYRHADGSYSTTEMQWNARLNRQVTLTRVAHPGPANVPAAARN